MLTVSSYFPNQGRRGEEGLHHDPVDRQRWRDAGPLPGRIASLFSRDLRVFWIPGFFLAFQAEAKTGATSGENLFEFPTEIDRPGRYTR